MNESSSKANLIANKKVDYLIDNLAKEVGVALVTTTFLFIFLLLVVEKPLLITWYAVMLLLAGLRLSLLLVRHKLHKKITELCYTALIFIVGINWAWLMLLVPYSAPVDYVLAVRFFLIGQCIMALFQFFINPKCSHAFSAPIFLVFTVELLMRPSPISVALGVGNFLFLGFIYLFSRHAGNYAREKLEWRAEVEHEKNNAERANAAKSRFLAAASHDIRQPLQSISLLTSALEHKKLGEETDAIVADMRGSITALDDYLSTLLDISKIDAGDVRINNTHFELNEVLTRMREEFSRQASSKGLYFTVERCEATLYTDPIQLTRIVRNLVSNAIRYTSAGLVKIQCKKIDEYVQINIIDSGIGISKQQQTSIFEDYTQIGNDARTLNKGVGLGLSIVSRLVKLMDIKLDLESEANKGSCFSITLPIADANESAEKRNYDSKMPQSVVVPQLDLDIIVIDDDPAVCRATAKALQAWGCRVHLFSSIVALKARLKNLTHKPDAMLVDYRFDNGLTGVDAAKLVQSHYQTVVPIIFISGDTESSEVKLLAEKEQVLYKPIKPAQLRACLNAIARKIQGRESATQNKLDVETVN